MKGPGGDGGSGKVFAWLVSTRSSWKVMMSAYVQLHGKEGAISTVVSTQVSLSMWTLQKRRFELLSFQIAQINLVIYTPYHPSAKHPSAYRLIKYYTSIRTEWGSEVCRHPLP